MCWKRAKTKLAQASLAPGSTARPIVALMPPDNERPDIKSTKARIFDHVRPAITDLQYVDAARPEQLEYVAYFCFVPANGDVGWLRRARMVGNLCGVARNSRRNRIQSRPIVELVSRRDSPGIGPYLPDPAQRR